MKNVAIESGTNIEAAARSEASRPVAMPYLNAAVPVGLVGAGAVALFILILDVVAGQPLGTPNALGATLLRGAPFDASAPIQPGLVFGYTLLHVATFIAVATAAVSAEFTLARAGMPVYQQLVLGVVGLALALQIVFLVLTQLLDLAWVGELGFERILIANLIAAVAMGVTVHLRGETRRRASTGGSRD